MLKIINTRGEILELENDTSIAVERNNTLFTDDIKQDLSYNEKASLSPNNKLFIKNAHLAYAKNELYSIDVLVYLANDLLFIGKMGFSIKNENIEFVLKPNFAAVAAFAVDASANQIDLGDQYQDLPAANLAGLMNDTVANPNNYKFIFVPLYNSRLGEGASTTATINEYINQYGGYSGGFAVTDYSFYPPPNVVSENTQFPKVLAVLEVIGKILGYSKIGGSWKDTEEGLTSYIFNLNPCPQSNTYDTLPFGMMLPNMTIGDLLKVIKKRFNLSFEFNNQNQTFEIESFDTAMKKAPIDLTNYIERVTEVDPPTQKGYKISLKVDEKDADWNRAATVDDPALFTPHFDLLIGDASQKIEIAAGTLKAYTSGARKSCSTKIIVADIGNVEEYNSNNNIDLRILKFDGLVDIGSGAYFPQSSPLDLSLKEAAFYNFLNYSKTFRLTANVPASLLHQINSTTVFAFKTKYGEYVKALNVKTSYDLKNSDYIKLDILCRNTAYQIKEQAILRDNFSVLGDGDFILTSYKSNYTGLLPAIKVRTGSSVFIDLTTKKNGLPCDKFGIGGQLQPCYPPTGATPTFFYDITFTITQGIPKFLRYQSKQTTFALQTDGSYTATLPYGYLPSNGVAFFVVY